MKQWKPLLVALLVLSLPAAWPAGLGIQSLWAAQGVETALPTTSSGALQRVWAENAPFYQKIFDHPYNQELLSGKLDEAVFREFIVQDYLFCQNYKKVHAILLAKAPDPEAERFMTGIIKAIDEEVDALHKVCVQKYHITEQELTEPPAYPSTELYNSYLVRVATLEPFAVGLAATLPCHWVYFQVGRDMKKVEKTPNNRYQAWIDQYGSTTWEKSETKRIVELAERHLQAAPEEIRVKMKQAFVTAMKLEYMFWDGVHRGARWVK
jgi:thiaminase/transcriptional activator TenA